MIESLGTGKEVVVDQRFGSVMKHLKAVMAEAELEIVGEFDVCRGFGERLDGKKCHLLLIDCPLTDFEALTVDTAAAVFLPVHVRVSGHGRCTRIFWADGAALLQGRLPSGGGALLRRLETRIASALDALAGTVYCPSSDDESDW
jgi:hypothetical protein